MCSGCPLAETSQWYKLSTSLCAGTAATQPLHAYTIALSEVSQKALIFSQITHKACAKCLVMTLVFFQRSLPCSAPYELTLDPPFCSSPMHDSQVADRHVAHLEAQARVDKLS